MYQISAVDSFPTKFDGDVKEKDSNCKANEEYGHTGKLSHNDNEDSRLRNNLL